MAGTNLSSYVGTTYTDPNLQFWTWQGPTFPDVADGEYVFDGTAGSDTTVGNFSNAQFGTNETSFVITGATATTLTITFGDTDPDNDLSYGGTYTVLGLSDDVILLTKFYEPTQSDIFVAITPSSPTIDPNADYADPQGLGGYFQTIDENFDRPTIAVRADWQTSATTFAPPPNTAAAPCFVSGTRLAGEHGDVAVEDVRVGDRLRTADGGVAGVIWTGRRSLRPAAHPMPAKVTPIRIAADAFAPGVPARDLLLSPDHAVFANGVLIPVAALVNDATIHPVERARVTYHHIETEAHTAILAENLPTETYLDTGNRRAFEGPGEMLHPDFAGTADGFAPRRTAGPDVQAVRAQLVARVAALGWTVAQDTAVTVLADGVVVTPRDGGYDIAGATELRIVSAAAVPANVTAGTDERRLGVALDVLTLDGHDMLRSDTLTRGWYAAEVGWRWTDGEAVVPLKNASRLTFRVAAGAQMWIPAEREHVRAA